MSSLRQQLVERIRAGGPITFAQYMEAALFDPESGFYTRGPGIGQGGHFATAAMAHPAFAAAIIAEAAATWEAIGRPKRFRVTEAGPGTGGLARRVTERLSALGIPHELVLIELSSGLQARQARRQEANVLPSDVVPLRQHLLGWGTGRLPRLGANDGTVPHRTALHLPLDQLVDWRHLVAGRQARRTRCDRRARAASPIN